MKKKKLYAISNQSTNDNCSMKCLLLQLKIGRKKKQKNIKYFKTKFVRNK